MSLEASRILYMNPIDHRVPGPESQKSPGFRCYDWTQSRPNTRMKKSIVSLRSPKSVNYMRVTAPNIVKSKQTKVGRSWPALPVCVGTTEGVGREVEEEDVDWDWD